MDSGHTENPDCQFDWQINRRKSKKKKNIYVFWKTSDGIHCAVTLKELVTVWIVVLAHEPDNLV